jgi:hypothetical protein
VNNAGANNEPIIWFSEVAQPTSPNYSTSFTFELWSGSTKLLNVRNSGGMDQSLSLASGSYQLTFTAYNTAGTHVYATRVITVSGSGVVPSCFPAIHL